MTPRQQLIGQYVNQLIADGVITKVMPLPEKARVILRSVGQDIASVLGVAGGTLAQSFFAALTQRMWKNG